MHELGTDLQKQFHVQKKLTQLSKCAKMMLLSYIFFKF